MPKDKGEYEVGFGKPPRHSRFKKGTSGNPKGRPKGSQHLATTFTQLADEKMWVNTPNGRKRMTRVEMGIAQLLNRCAKGDPKAMREVMHWKKVFGDVVPPLVPPIIQISFRTPKPYAVETQQTEIQEERILEGEVADDDTEYEVVDDIEDE